jgi:hypothetical protein
MEIDCVSTDMRDPAMDTFDYFWPLRFTDDVASLTGMQINLYYL